MTGLQRGNCPLSGQANTAYRVSRLPTLKQIAERQINKFIIAAVSLVFLQFKEFELYWGAVFFTTRRVLEKSFF